MDEINWDAPIVAPKAGGVYGDRRGIARGPMSHAISGGSYKFRDNGGTLWTARGSAWISSHESSPRDLITIITEPGSVEPDATQETGVVVEEIVIQCTITSPATDSLLACMHQVILGDDGDFTIKDGAYDQVVASPAAAVAIARAILRMAGESK